MKKFYIVLLAAFFLAIPVLGQSPQAVMAAQKISAGDALPTFVQAGSCGNGGGATCNFSLTMTAGHSAVFFMLSAQGVQTLTVGADTCSAANASHDYAGTGAGATRGKGCYVASVAGGAETFTCSTTVSTFEIACVGAEFTSALSTLDQNAVADTGNTGAGGTLSAGAVTTTVANEIVFGAFLNATGTGEQPWTASGSWLLPSNGNGGASGYDFALVYQIVSATGTYTPQVTPTVIRDTVGFTASFK